MFKHIRMVRQLMRLMNGTWVDPPDFSGRSRTKLLASELDILENDLRYLYNTMNTLVPPGIFAPYGGDTAPTGWLLCQGQGLSTTTYAALFAAIAYRFGGTGATFNLPDLRGRVVMGAGTGTGGGASGTGAPAGGSALTARTAGGWGGAELHVLTQAELASHGHTINEHTHFNNFMSQDHDRDHGHNLEAHQHAINHFHLANFPRVKYSTANATHAHNYGANTMAEGVTGGGDGAVATIDIDGNAKNAPGGENISGGAGWTGGRAGATTGHLHQIYGATGGASDRGTNNAGSGTGHNNVQPFIVSNVIIKT